MPRPDAYPAAPPAASDTASSDVSGTPMPTSMLSRPAPAAVSSSAASTTGASSPASTGPSQHPSTPSAAANTAATMLGGGQPPQQHHPHPLPLPPPPPPPPSSADAKKPRACEACRALKVRCDFVAAPGGGGAAADDDVQQPCRRCAKAGRRCVVTRPTFRRQKKTDSRVADLEKKIDLLTASLQASRHDAVGGGSGGGGGGSGSGDLVNGLFRRLQQQQQLSPQSQPQPQQPQQQPHPHPHSHSQAQMTSPSDAASTSTPVLIADASPAPTGMTAATPPPPPMVMAGQKRKRKPAEARDGSGDGLGGGATAGAAFAGSTTGGGGGGGGGTSSDTNGSSEHTDCIDRGLLTMDQATELFRRYTEQMVGHMPAVVFGPETTAAMVRKATPVLFLAVLAAASTELPDLQRVLVRELMQAIAERVVVVGEKSLELVQALQLATIWYWPPEHFEQLKFYQLIHMGAVMAIDLGLGKRRLCGGAVSGATVPGGGGGGLGGFGLPFSHLRDTLPRRQPLVDPCSLEGRRAWLASYFLAGNTSMALHRPSLVRWTPFMDECVRVLETAPDAAPTDAYLCHLVWTHRLAEDVGLQFAMDDPTAGVSFADPRTQYALRGFERELERYRATIPRHLLQPTLRMSLEVLNLYMNEIALQTYSGGQAAVPEALTGDGVLSQAHIRSLATCLVAIDGIYDAFLAADVPALRCLPVFNFVRVIYATVVLVKLYLFAAAPGAELGKVIDKDSIKVEHHLNALLDKLGAAAEGNRSRPAGKFLVIVAMIRSWFVKQQQQQQQQAGASAGQQQQQQQQQAPSTTQPAGQSVQPVQSTTQQQPQPPPAATASPQTTPPQPPPPMSALYPTANTPLQLLSEIAANDSAAKASQQRGGGSGGSHNSSSSNNASSNNNTSNTSSNNAGMPPFVPPLYNGAALPPHPPPPPPPQAALLTAAPGLVPAGGAAVGPVPGPADLMGMYPTLDMGENLGYALDLTFSGLGGSFPDAGGIEDYMLADPWLDLANASIQF